MRHDSSAPAAVLSPHLDDAVLSAWTVLSGPGEVLVVNVCTAIPDPGFTGSWDRITGEVESADAMKLRFAEDAAAMERAGRHALGLGFLDGQYRDEPLEAEALVAALAEAVPAASALHAPAGLGRHADHVAVRDAAIDLSRAGGIPLWLYADLPYAARWGWPASVTGAEPDPHLRPESRWEEALTTAPCAREALLPEVVGLSEEEAARKLHALEAYGTQLPALNAGPMDLLRRPEVLRYEVRWEVRPEARPGRARE